MKSLTIDKVTFVITPEEEFISASDALSFESTGADHSEWIQRVQEEQEINIWLWCAVTVTAKYKGFEGNAYLGGCAYESEEDFIKGGSYEQMQEEAFDELKEAIKAQIDAVSEFI